MEAKRYERVLVELLNSDIFEGELIRNSSRSIELSNIYCQATNTTYDGIMTFYRNEIASVTRISKPDEDKTSSAVPEKSTSITSNGAGLESSRNITMDCDEFYRLRQTTFEFIFIDNFSSSFDNAVETLSNRQSVAVVGLGNTLRAKAFSLLLMADFKQIYIFDMRCLVQLRGLRHILESTFICKVVHDGCALYDCLLDKYKVKMENVFDTKVVDKVISKKEGHQDVERDLSECLTHHFNFPPSLLAQAMEDSVAETWLERPVLKVNKIKAAQLVAYLISLRDKLVTHILQPYTSEMENTYSKFRKTADSGLLTFEKK